jgi:hypothetical protein
MRNDIITKDGEVIMRYFMSYLEFEIFKKVIAEIDDNFIQSEKANFWHDGYGVAFKGKIPSSVLNSIEEKISSDSYSRKSISGSNKENDIYLCFGTKESLLKFIIEMSCYYGNSELSKKYDELLGKMNLELLKVVDPTSSAYDWMQGNQYDREFYNSCIRDKDRELRKILSAFDEAVDPFLNPNLKINDIIGRTQRLIISAGDQDDNVPSLYRRNRSGAYRLTITDSSTSSRAEYFKRFGGIEFRFTYKPDDNQTIEIIHHFLSYDNPYAGKGETLSVRYYDGWENTRRLEYNVTSGTIKENKGDAMPHTEEQMKVIYDELSKAIEYSSNKTFDELKKNVKQI